MRGLKITVSVDVRIVKAFCFSYNLSVYLSMSTLTRLGIV